ncbi:MAG: 16S rRNA (guanine(966)-N(2))-methyltransferase RsmD [Commensalibacter sp.]|nr:16S rRNA (guanine(966)-N(2))-methyltransferase RsmD [Commensalibacter sp.]
MRIIAGQCRGTRLKAPKGDHTRPTSDRMRQTLFDMLTHPVWGGTNCVQDSYVLDAFAGTGALGLEALSRGAKSACFFENNAISKHILQENITHCRMQPFTKIYNNILHPPLAEQPCSLIFFDPPYRHNLILPALTQILNKGWLSSTALLITETAIDESLALTKQFFLLTERKLGVSCLRIWQYRQINE